MDSFEMFRDENDLSRSASSLRADCSEQLPCLQLCRVFENLRISASPSDSKEIVPFHDNVVQPLLEALLPWQAVASHSREVASSENGDRQISQAFLKLINFAASNNFAGVEGLVSHLDLYHYLRPLLTDLLHSPLNPQLPSAIALNPLGSLSVSAMLETLFHGAIEAGDVHAVRNLVLYSKSNIRVNDQVCSSTGSRLTALERAVQLRHVVLVKCLIELGADVNKHIDSVDAPQGGLEHALKDPEGPCFELVDLLITVGGKIRLMIFANIMGNFHRGLLLRLVPNVQGPLSGWLKSGTLHRLFETMETDFLMNLLQILDDDVDFNFASPSFRRSVIRASLDETYTTRHIIDFAVRRGEPKLTRMLRQRNAQYTRDSLVAAIKSNNEETISLLLGEPDLCWNGFSQDHFSTPFAEAVVSRATDLMDLLFESGCAGMAASEVEFAAGISAASQIGDIELLNVLLNIRQPASPPVLGFALFRALIADCTDAAIILLDLGASMDIWDICQYFDTCDRTMSSSLQDAECNWQLLLSIAVHNRNETMVKALLEHEGPSLRPPGMIYAILPPWWAKPPLPLAIDWAHSEIIETLLASGACCYQTFWALSTAVNRRNSSLLERLLQYGLWSEESSRSDVQHPLTEAVAVHDLDIIRMLLDANIDCVVPEALCMAMSSFPDAFELLTEKLKHRKPTYPSRLGLTLCQAVIERRPQEVQRLIDCDVRAATTFTRYGMLISSPLANAILAERDCNLGLTEMILEAGADPNAIYTEGEHDGAIKPRGTALLIAIETKNTRLIRLLIEAGADVNKPAGFGLKRTPLQKAVEIGSPPLINLLLQYGADVDGLPAPRGGATALQMAAIGGYLGIFNLLLEHGANMATPAANIDGRKPIEGAAEHGRLDMVHHILRLLDSRGLLHDGSSELWRARELAAENGHHVIAEVLAQKLVQISHVNVDASHLRLEGTDCMAAVRAALKLDHAKADVYDNGGNAVDSTGTGASTYVCKDCGSTMSNVSSLRRHERTHTGDRNFMCPICSFAFARKDTLDKHIARHHPAT